MCKWRRLVFILPSPRPSRWKLNYPVMIFTRLDASAVRKLRIWCWCVCVCRSRRASECCSPLSVACLRPLNFRSMAGQILAATLRLDRPCPFKIERWLACFGSWSAEGSHELTRRETTSDSLEEGMFLTTAYWPNGFKGKQTLRCKSVPAGNSPINSPRKSKIFSQVV